MTGTRKAGVLVLILVLAASSMLWAESAEAQSIPKPAVPQFQIQYLDYSYDTPATNSTDPYTGQQIQHSSQHIGDIRVEGKIKNQPFTPCTLEDPNGTGAENIRFYYNVRYKGHFGDEWTEIYGYRNKYYIDQKSGSEYTNFTIKWQEFPEGKQIDYQVKALIGYESRTYIGPYPKPVIIGEESDWSSTLTLIFTKNETANGISFASNIDTTPYPPLPSTPPTPTVIASPTQNPLLPTENPQDAQTNLLAGFDWEQATIIVLVVVVAILAVALVLSHRRRV